MTPEQEIKNLFSLYKENQTKRCAFALYIQLQKRDRPVICPYCKIYIKTMVNVCIMSCNEKNAFMMKFLIRKFPNLLFEGDN